MNDTKSVGDSPAVLPSPRRAMVKVTSTVCGDYWGLTGVVQPERSTKGYMRDQSGEVIEVDLSPCCVIEFDRNDEFNLRCAARGTIGLVSELAIAESELQFLDDVAGSPDQDSSSGEDVSEFQQVSALLCMDIDLIADICADKELTIEDLRSQILDLKRSKDELIQDGAARLRRYTAAKLLLSCEVTTNKSADAVEGSNRL